MKDVRNDELIRLSMKPELSPEEEARLEKILRGEPDAHAAWDEERALSRALQSLPDVPLSNNFTSRVMQEIDLEEARDQRMRHSHGGWFRGFWPRLSWGTAALVLGLVGMHEYSVSKRTQLANDVALVSKDAAKLPSAEVLQDFDAINQLRQVSMTSDDDLLIALQ
ncbi:MAG TPA: hypothetical protein VK846_06455 [Candidatus Limnocylindria bacterium]|nr:hypothetical protein [Candidatus Limnocylindria bacterium]